MHSHDLCRWSLALLGVALAICAMAPQSARAADRLVIAEEFTNPG